MWIIFGPILVEYTCVVGHRALAVMKMIVVSLCCHSILHNQHVSMVAIGKRTMPMANNKHEQKQGGRAKERDSKTSSFMPFFFFGE
mmetsp:Transcript_30146/g.44548  ORF Transcript_30146/g.44548 Transcript_30146/m.44548 type:complete len:86 (+) Transcript_30146:652-909(+)